MGFLTRETLIERLAREMQWLVSEREGDFHMIRPDDGSPLRYIAVRCRDDRPFVTMWTLFPVRFPLSAITPELTLGLLKRNHDLFFGRWCVNVAGSCELSLSLRHTTTKAGLTAGTFKTCCREMLDEREALHQLLRGQLANLQPMTLPTGQPLPRRDASGKSLATGKDGAIVWLGQ